MSEEANISGGDGGFGGGGTAVADAPPSTSPDTSPPAAARNAPAPSEAHPTPTGDGREAFARLLEGEDSKAIQKDLHKRASVGQGTKPAPTPAATPPAPTTTAATPAADPAALGLEPQEVAALRRAKIDPAMLAAVPPTNRKAVARSLMAAQAETDRQYQLARNGKNPTGDVADPKGAGNEPTPESRDEATADRQQKPPKPAQPQQQQRDGAFEFKLSDDDFKTLADVGGEEFAKSQATVYQRGLAALEQHVMQSYVAPLQHALAGVARLLEDRDWQEAAKAVKATPGYEQLSDDQLKQVREQAMRLITANGDPQYLYRQAAPVAAAALFLPDATRAAQQQLAKQAQATLAGQPDRANGRRSEPQPLSESDKSRLIFRKMTQDGLDAKAARAAVDGGT